MEYDILIIGGGPAGLTAAIYAARGGKRTALLTGSLPGGNTTKTHLIENFSGVPAANGWELAETMRAQAEQAGAEILYENAIRLVPSPTLHTVETAEGHTYTAKCVIVATGTKHRLLGIPNEEKLTGHGVSYCATCDGGFFRKKTVAVVGGGATAFTDALYLNGLASKVYLIHRRSGFRADATLIERAKKAERIEFKLGYTVCELKGDPLSAIVLQDKNGNKEDLHIDGLFVAVGAEPDTAWLNGQIDTDGGYLLTDAYMRTNVPRIYAAGDVRVTPLRQIITACADGAIAAESAIADCEV